MFKAIFIMSLVMFLLGFIAAPGIMWVVSLFGLHWSYMMAVQLYWALCAAFLPPSFVVAIIREL